LEVFPQIAVLRGDPVVAVPMPDRAQPAPGAVRARDVSSLMAAILPEDEKDQKPTVGF